MLFLYLASAIGIQISMHYCGEDLAAVTIIENASCCCDKDSIPNDCCKDEYKVFKIKDDQNKTEIASQKSFALDEVFFPIYFSFFQRTTSKKLVIFKASRPPPKVENSMPLYKKNHAYLYYS